MNKSTIGWRLPRREPGLALIFALFCAAAVIGAQEPSSPEADNAAEERHLDYSVIPPSDASRDLLATGRRLYEGKRYGEALAAFQAAIDERGRRYRRAAAMIEAVQALQDKSDVVEKSKKDSIKDLITRLAKEDLIDAELERIDGIAGQSLNLRASLLREKRLSTRLADFLDALLAVLDLRPASSFHNSLAALCASSLELSAYPEAEYWVGKVYLAEGELRLAELQIQHAYALNASLVIPQERFDMLYDLASLYSVSRNYKAYESVLLDIAAEDPLFAADKRYLRDAMERALSRSGFGTFMSLTRAKAGVWGEAERLLGEFYLESGRVQAVAYLAAVVNSSLSVAIERLEKRDSSWEYRNLADLLQRIGGNRELFIWAKDISLYRALYELGLALDRGGNREGGAEIWQVLSTTKGIEPWNTSAARALRDSGKR